MGNDRMNILLPNLNGVRDGEQKGVAIALDNGRLQVVAWNQGGYDLTTVDLQDILDVVDSNNTLRSLLAHQRDGGGKVAA